MAIPYITADMVEARLSWGAVADAIIAGSKAAAPKIGDQFLREGDNTLLSRAAWIAGMGIGVKSVTVMPGNAANGLPSIHGAMLVFDDATGQIEAVIDSDLVTKWKTAADSLAGARLLARADAARLMVIGAGRVAESVIDAYRSHWPELDVMVWARKPAQAEALANAKGARLATDLPRAVARADIIATATMAKEPVLWGEWLHPGQHIDLIGAFTADMREANDTALQRAKIFVDSRATTVGHIGELMIPLASGAITEAQILGELPDLATGRAGRHSAQDITLFKNGGGAHLDLMTARLILDIYRGA